MQTLEKTFTLDRDMAKRADRKLRRYGMSLDDALHRSLMDTLTLIVTVRGRPGLCADAGVSLSFDVDGRAMRPRNGFANTPAIEECDGVFSVRMEEIGLDAFADTKSELAAEVRNQLAMLWREYALADDRELTESARKVKRNLLKLTAPQFRNLVDCPLPREAYEDILREQGLA